MTVAEQISLPSELRGRTLHVGNIDSASQNHGVRGGKPFEISVKLRLVFLSRKLSFMVTLEVD